MVTKLSYEDYRVIYESIMLRISDVSDDIESLSFKDSIDARAGLIAPLEMLSRDLQSGIKFTLFNSQVKLMQEVIHWRIMDFAGELVGALDDKDMPSAEQCWQNDILIYIEIWNNLPSPYWDVDSQHDFEIKIEENDE